MYNTDRQSAWALGALALCLLLSLACSGLLPSELQAPPRGASVTEAPPDQPSTITLPLSLDYDALQATIQEKVPQVLLDEQDREVAARIRVDAHAERSGDVGLRLVDDALRFILPVDVKVEVYRKRVGGKRGVTLGTIQASLLVRVDVQPKLGQDWSLELSPVVSHRWKKTPTFKSGPVQLDLEERLDKLLAPKWKEVQAKIAERLAEQQPVRQRVEQAWTQLAQPRKTRENPEMWLRFTPSALYASDPVLGKDALGITVGARGLLVGSLGEALGAVHPGPLPARGTPPRSSGARLAIPLLLDWDSLGAMAREKLEGGRYQTQLPAGAGEASATLVELTDLYPSGESLALGLVLALESPAGDLEVRTWLMGRPAMDVASQTLTIEDFAYAASSGNSWIDAAHGAIAEEIRVQLSQRLSFPLGDQLNQLRSELNQALAKGRSRKGMSLTGKMDEISFSGVRLTDQAIEVDLLLSGRLSLSTN